MYVEQLLPTFFDSRHPKIFSKNLETSYKYKNCEKYLIYTVIKITTIG